MVNEKLDRRQRYTQTVIKQTLLELMADRPIDKITVSELCAKADINRGTFYLHYSDIYTLLSTVENEITTDIDRAIRHMTTTNQLDLLVGICRYIESNGLFARAYFSDHGNKLFIRKIMLMAKDYFFTEYRSHHLSEDLVELEYLYSFFVQGVLGILHRWTNSNFQSPAEHIAKIINQLDYSIKHNYHSLASGSK